MQKNSLVSGKSRQGGQRNEDFDKWISEVSDLFFFPFKSPGHIADKKNHKIILSVHNVTMPCET